jgi:hypothetical protein
VRHHLGTRRLTAPPMWRVDSWVHRQPCFPRPASTADRARGEARPGRLVAAEPVRRTVPGRTCPSTLIFRAGESRRTDESGWQTER